MPGMRSAALLLPYAARPGKAPTAAPEDTFTIRTAARGGLHRTTNPISQMGAAVFTALPTLVGNKRRELLLEGGHGVCRLGQIENEVAVPRVLDRGRVAGHTHHCPAALEQELSERRPDAGGGAGDERQPSRFGVAKWSHRQPTLRAQGPTGPGAEVGSSLTTSVSCRAAARPAIP